MNPPYTIHPEERTWAAIAHLSGFGGYIVPLGGVIAPIVIMLAKKESPVISSIAKQALILNIACFLSFIPIIIMFCSLYLIPLAILAAILVSTSAVILPIVGVVRAGDGYYFKYPLVGQYPY